MLETSIFSDKIQQSMTSERTTRLHGPVKLDKKYSLYKKIYIKSVTFDLHVFGTYTENFEKICYVVGKVGPFVM